MFHVDMIMVTAATFAFGMATVDMPPIAGVASVRKVGGIWFARLGRLRCSFCVARY